MMELIFPENQMPGSHHVELFAMTGETADASPKKLGGSILLLLILVFAVTVGMVYAQLESSGPEFQGSATGTEKAWAEALEHKAEQGNAEAQFDISQAYMDGHVFKKSWSETVKWLRASADQGFPEAQANLGGLYYLGNGVHRDYSQAIFWTQKAADQGNVKAEYNLGLMYALGQGVKKSDSRAVRWYLKSAEQGHQVAAYDIGVAYSHGLGIAEDDVRGYMWFLLALRFGWQPSKVALEGLDRRLPRATVAEARKKANQWIRVHPDVKGVSL
jgi:TPR repeat protein